MVVWVLVVVLVVLVLVVVLVVVAFAGHPEFIGMNGTHLWFSATCGESYFARTHRESEKVRERERERHDETGVCGCPRQQDSGALRNKSRLIPVRIFEACSR